MPTKHSFDIIIFGAGAAGLWLLNTLKLQGYNCLLLENNTIGGQQTIHSQGIIHGGLKYALSGALTSESDSIANMPDIWRKCLQDKTGNGNKNGQPFLLNLHDTAILSDTQYMWSNKSLASRFTTFFASKVLRGRINKLERNDYPGALNNPQFKGSVYKLKDLVIDTDSLLKNLIAPVRQFIYKIPTTPIDFKQTDKDVSFAIAGEEFTAQCVIFSAGFGNQALTEQADLNQTMQHRPLQMLAVKHRHPLLFYGHCIGTGSTPRLTITSHRVNKEEIIWYIGGALAEAGALMDSDTLIHKGKMELVELFPWLDFSHAQWASWQGTRAEPKQNQLNKPDTSFVSKEGRFLICWPTKLTLVPDLAEKLLPFLTDITPLQTAITLPNLPVARVSAPFWEELFD